MMYKGYRDFKKGIRGKIKDLNPEKSYMIVEIAKGVNIEVDRNAVYADMEQQMQK